MKSESLSIEKILLQRKEVELRPSSALSRLDLQSNDTFWGSTDLLQISFQRANRARRFFFFIVTELKN